ncbi:cysteine synthase family protein [Hymenobacter sp. BRD128]|uniref:PLP-dependent cysteine synthase family protein n=1 Tax=Hymenobacter sp. BRD128 TaxID=2675878 RepID=UPI0015636D3D|nr:cysteine synthase family protein [Hymenobacter sp. BRD128]QKG55828.1 cysteine synthase family protein [Hymenobacter sp. BRD128]
MRTAVTAKNDIISAIGNTPMVKLEKIVPDDCADIYVKLEYLNPTGSYKDRMVLAIIQEAEKRGVLKPGMTVVECTAGNTGTSLAFVCSAKGYRFKAISSDAFAKEKLQAMRLFGAEVELLSNEGRGITPDLIPRMIKHVQKLSTQEGFYWTKQFENTDALAGFREMGKEILTQITQPINVFCAGVGTAGMLTGVSQELKQANPATQVVVLEPASAALLAQGIPGSHKVDGIGVGFVPPLLKQAAYDAVRMIEEPEARRIAKLLASEEGILAGTSSGLNVSAAIALGKELGPGHAVVTVACDSGLKYLSSGLFD